MTANKGIPFVDLVTPHNELKKELSRVFQNVLETASFIGGPMVEEFEQAFAEFCQVQHCVGVGSGTDALRFALMAAGINQGDVVVTVPNTFIATAEAISQAGAQVEFIDIDERTHNMDPGRLKEYLELECYVDSHTGALTSRRFHGPVKAVIPVHLYGQPAELDPIQKLAEAYDLTIVEDACQAHGAEYFSERSCSWEKAGSMGKAAAFSFYPGKNLGACGEAGAVTTNDAELAQKIRMLRDHGQSRKYYHQMEGFNGRLDAIQAGILRVKLGRLAEWTEMRRDAANRYLELLSDLDDKITLPFQPTWARSVHHLFVVRVSERDAVMKHLTAEHIGTGIHYPIPLHLQHAYASLGYKLGDFPAAERVSGEILSLPMFPGLTADQQHRVVYQLGKCAAPRNGRALSEALFVRSVAS
jgi:dTDP-4-amino-4,6-dideoxygalactose transaminase